MPRRIRPILALLALLAPPFASAAPNAAPSPYAALAATEARVAAIGFRLTTANAAWCPVRQAQMGIIWGDRRLYDERQWESARAAYETGAFDTSFVAAAAPGSPAGRSGLKKGDAIAWVDFRPLDEGDGSDPFGRIAALERLLAARSADAKIMIGLTDGRTIPLRMVPGCVSDFRVEPKEKPGAVADGRLVLINQGLADFTADDNELAAAIAHELAHNILRHRERLDAVGVDRGLGKQFGRSARLFRQTEIEADRLSVWLLAGADYDPAAAARFWSKFGQRSGRPLFQAGTHPGWRDRVKALEAEAATIAAARAAGQPLRPPLVDAPPPLE